MKRVLYLLACIIALSSCTDQSEHQVDQVDDDPKRVSRVGVAYALGGKGDLSYNDAASDGIKKLRERDISVKEFEPNTLDDYSKGLELLSIAKLQVIFCIGFLYDGVVEKVASSHKNTMYVILDGSAFKIPNVSSVKFNAEQGSFLVGVVAGRLTEAKRVGFIGGMNIPIINEFLSGYQNGAKWIDKGIDVLPFYVGTGGAAFTDPVRGREAALSAISKGVDVIYHAAGASGNGVIKAAKEHSIFAIGVDVDQNYLAPKTVVTSMKKNFDVAMEYIVDRIDNGEDIGGENILLGLAEGAVSLASIDEPTKSRLGNVLEEATQYIINNN